ncbi:MAG: hypothetical protein ING31_11640, partial [Burkholderiales bacterium]|nr:hypothetical protein [Burkholderiales bacterium]
SWNLVISINSTTDRVTVTDYFWLDGASNYGLETISFSDGTIWNQATVKANMLVATAGNDTITGYATNDTINGLAGNDAIFGGSGNDTLDGGVGNDTLTGGVGADRFIFTSAGFGKDAILDFEGGAAVGDVLEFSTAMFANWAALLIKTAQVGADTVITVNTNDTVTLKDFTLSTLNQNDAKFI